MTALYELALEYRSAADKLAEMDLDPQTVADTLESISGDLEQKAVAVAMVTRNFDATALAIKEAEAEMSARRKAIEKRAEALRRYLMDNMLACNIKRIECPHFVLSVKDNPASVDVFDADQLPDTYLRQPEMPPPAPDKAAIKDALKAGQDVPGARLTHSQRIEIK